MSKLIFGEEENAGIQFLNQMGFYHDRREKLKQMKELSDDQIEKMVNEIDRFISLPKTKPSIVIVSLKNPWEIKTSKSIPINHVHRVVIETCKGVSKARNKGFQKCKEADIIVFVDDDLDIPTEVWDCLFDVAPGIYKMMQGAHFPISRVMSIHRKDFERLGGFDENINYTGEDLDFYIRATLDGMILETIPMNAVTHEPHERPDDRRDFEGSYILAKHGAKTLKKLGLETRLPTNFLLKKNLRKTILRISGYLYYKIRGYILKGGERNNKTR